MDKPGNYSQYTGDISVGFWVPYVICSLNMSVQNSSFRENTSLSIEDDSIRYFFRADVHTKNVPYTMRVDLGFNNLKRSYTSAAAETDEFKSFFAGLEGTYTINPSLKVLLGGEMPVYSWGAGNLGNPPKKTILFEARMGVIYSFGKQ